MPSSPNSAGPKSAGLSSTGLGTGLQLFDQRKWAEALDAIGVGDESPEDPALNDARVLRAACLARLGRISEAVEQIERAERLAQEVLVPGCLVPFSAMLSWLRGEPRTGQPDWFVTYVGGAIQLTAGDSGQALERFRLALERFPVAGELWYHIGLAALVNGQDATARDAFERVASLDEVVFDARLKRVQELTA